MVVAVVLFVINCAASLYLGWFMLRQHRTLVEFGNDWLQADAENDELRKQAGRRAGRGGSTAGIIQKREIAPCRE